jgi:hypothetical protein
MIAIPNTPWDPYSEPNFQKTPLKDHRPSPQPHTPPSLLDLDDQDSSPPYKAMTPALSVSANDTLTTMFDRQHSSGIFPTNISTTVDAFGDPFYNHQSGGSSSGKNTPIASPAEERESDDNDVSFDLDEEPSGGTTLQGYRNFGESRREIPPQAVISSRPLSRSPTELDFIFAQKLQREYDNEQNAPNGLHNQNEFARQLDREERAREMEHEADLEASRRLASQLLAQEEKERALTNQFNREYKASQEAFRRDQAAALAQQKAWEDEIRADEEDRRKFIAEMERQDEEARARDLEAAKKLAEELDREEEEERQRLAAEAAEAERRERQADCVVCMEPSNKIDMCFLECEQQHYYCGECIVGKLYPINRIVFRT